MRLGIVADIHDAVGPLKRALTRFGELGVDQVISLGDAFETFEPGQPAVEVARLLDEAGAIGIWGNHDFGLSHDVADVIRSNGDGGLLRFAGTLLPQLIVAGARFSHIEPRLDPFSLADLWAFDEVPNTAERARRNFEAVPERLIFVGRFHQWFAVSAEDRLPWDGAGPLDLAGAKRYLVGISAVRDNWCAVFDIERAELLPIPCAA